MKELDLLTTLDLAFDGTDKKKTCYQFVYGSQSYGTLFGIYARLGGKLSVDKSSFEITSISLFLLNYQGELNIGFTKDNIGLVEGKKKENPGDLNFYFGVQATSKKNKHSLRFKKSVKVEKGSSLVAMFNRILHPLPGFSFRETGRTIEPKPGPRGQTQKNHTSIRSSTIEMEQNTTTGSFDLVWKAAWLVTKR